jgi:hypothetical protein
MSPMMSSSESSLLGPSVWQWIPVPCVPLPSFEEMGSVATIEVFLNTVPKIISRVNRIVGPWMHSLIGRV